MSPGTRFGHLGAPIDLDKAVAQQHAVNLTSDDKSDKPACLNDLVGSLLRWFERLGELADLKMVMEALRRAKGFMKHSFPHAELAVLSACQIATGDKELPEEVVHLAAGMLLEYCCYDAVY